jgi:hypothetical protein
MGILEVDISKDDCQITVIEEKLIEKKYVVDRIKNKILKLKRALMIKKLMFKSIFYRCEKKQINWSVEISYKKVMVKYIGRGKVFKFLIQTSTFKWKNWLILMQSKY